VALSLIAAVAAGPRHRTDLSAGARAACALGLVGPALLCLSTAGRLWLLLVAAGTLTIDSWRDTAAALATGWSRILLGALGGSELLMSTGAALAAGRDRHHPLRRARLDMGRALLLTAEAFAIAATLRGDAHLDRDPSLYIGTTREEIPPVN